MSVDNYYNLSLLEVFAKRVGYYQRLELEYYLPMRKVYTIIHNAHAKYPKTEVELIPLSIDEKLKNNRLQELEENRDEINEWIAKQQRRGVLTNKIAEA